MINAGARGNLCTVLLFVPSPWQPLLENKYLDQVMRNRVRHHCGSHLDNQPFQPRSNLQIIEPCQEAISDPTPPNLSLVPPEAYLILDEANH